MKIIIGCANFGNYYGLRKKNLNIGKITNIIKLAKKLGINHYDTAYDYKKSESILGKNIEKFYLKKKLFIDTKLPKKFKFKKDNSNIEKIILNSQKKLKVKKINTLYVHDTKQLLQKKGKRIYSEMVKLKKKKLIRNIGISVYTTKETYDILKKFKIDVIQVPFNLLDNRFINKNFLRFVKKKKCKIVARSIFLKGLLLKKPNKINKYFKRWSNLLIDLNKKIINKKLSIKKLTLLKLKKEKAINNFIVGISNTNQLREISTLLKSKRTNLLKKIDIPNVEDENLINPRYWKLR